MKINEEFLYRKHETITETKERLKKKFPNIIFGENIITKEMSEERHKMVDELLKKDNNYGISKTYK